MDRRRYLGALVGAGTAGFAGCTTLGGPTALTDPEHSSDRPGEASLEWDTDGSSLCSFGVDATVLDGLLVLSTEIPHRDGTRIDALTLRVWQPGADLPAEVAPVSPVEGDSSPPPTITLSTPDRGPGTQISVRDLDDLADETISTLDLLVRPRSPASELAIGVEIALSEGTILRSEYDLSGEVRLAVPERAQP